LQVKEFKGSIDKEGMHPSLKKKKKKKKKKKVIIISKYPFLEEAKRSSYIPYFLKFSRL
jgi:hypothetical protein